MGAGRMGDFCYISTPFSLLQAFFTDFAHLMVFLSFQLFSAFKSTLFRKLSADKQKELWLVISQGSFWGDCLL